MVDLTASALRYVRCCSETLSMDGGYGGSYLLVDFLRPLFATLLFRNIIDGWHGGGNWREACLQTLDAILFGIFYHVPVTTGGERCIN